MSEKELVVMVAERDAKIDELLRDFRPLHSEFQIDYFIVASAGPTDWCKYKQALREIHSRQGTIRKYGREIRKLVIKLEGLSSRPSGPLEEIELEELTDALRETMVSMKDCEREMKRFIALALELKEGLGEITDERRAELEERSWIEKITSNVRMDLQSARRIQPATAQSLSCLPVAMQQQIIESCQPPTNEAGKVIKFKDDPNGKRRILS